MRVGSNGKEKEYSLAIDSSTLTWIRCGDLSKGNAPKRYYTPVPRQVVACHDPICGSIKGPGCAEQCNYQVTYGDYGSSTGLLVNDSVPLSLANGTEVTPTLVFGCGLFQEYYQHKNSYVDGVVGLGKGEASILAQLSKMKVTKNIVGHCFNQTSVGFLFFGDQFVPKSGIAWTKMSNRTNRYLGKADFQYDGNDTISKGLKIEFDSGSHYNYFCGAAYGALISRENGDVCLGILTSATDNLGKNRNVIGAISMQDRIVVYDNENSRVGWADNCSSLLTTS